MQIKTIALACVALVGCGDDGGGAVVDAARNDSPTVDMMVTIDSPMIDTPIDSPGGNPFTVTGTIATSGSANPTFVAWVVSSGSPDYLWKFGEGTSTATTYMVTMGSNPPAQAINSYGIAVGIVVMIPDGTALPADGMLDDNGFLPIALSADHAIIYKVNGGGGLGWTTSFPDGYACGVCVRTGATFDTFTVTACTNVELTRDLNADVCNWT